MSGNISQTPRPKVRTSKLSTQAPNHEPEQHRRKHRELYKSRREQFGNTFSSPDSEAEIMVDDIVPMSSNSYKKAERHGRTKERSSKQKSRGHSLDNLLSSAQHSMALSGNYRDVSQYFDDENSDEIQYDQQLHHQPPEATYNHRRSKTDETTSRMFYRGQKTKSPSEVYELQMRILQMEKTLRWWSDCTANWREKWTKVRSERNRAREELKRSKLKLEDNGKELLVLREQKSMLIQENTSLKLELKNHHKADAPSEDSTSYSETPRLQSVGVPNKSKAESPNFRKGGVKSNTSVASNSSSVDEDHLSQKVVALQLKVEESVKTIQAERNSKLTLHKTIEDLSQQLSTYKKKFEEMKDGKQDALKQLSRIQESHRLDLVRINQNLEEELENRSQMERKIHDLREEIERLQEENTCEWGRRERLETEKLQLERENKRLKTSSDEMQTEMERRRKTTAEDRDHELQHAQIELHDLTEELSDLRRQYTKDQKLLEDKQEELAHSRRRAEKHETEVRALRNRVEEIKKQQTNTEDELDSAQNQLRKLVRQVEEKDEELEKLHLQLGQLQTRLRRETPTPSWPKSPFTRSGKDDLISSDSSSDV